MALLDLHYVWAIGHAITVACSSVIIFRTVLFRSIPLALYKFLYTGTLLSYSIVCYKAYGFPQANAAFVRKAFVDENVQYALLAVWWFISKPLNRELNATHGDVTLPADQAVSIIPFATFSLFHSLTFLRTNILPKFIPPPPTAQPGQPAPQRPPPAMLEKLSRAIHLWVKGNYDTAMRFVAYAEMAILARSVLGAITFRTSFITPLFLAHLLRLRYHASPFVREAVDSITQRTDSFAAGQGGAVQQYYGMAKRAIASWGGGNLVPQQPAPARGPAAGQAEARR